VVEGGSSIDRRRFVRGAALATLTLAARPVRAADGPRRIGWLVGTPPSDQRGEAFRRALSERDGRRDATSPSSGRRSFRVGRERSTFVEQAAKEFVATNVAVVVASGTAWALAAQRATHHLPIVMIASGFPVEAGIAASLARPGGNVTGNTIYAGGEVFGEIVQMLREVRPGLSHVGVFWDYTSPAFPPREVAVALDELKGALARFGARMSVWQNESPDDVDRALAALVPRRVDALIVTGFAANFQRRERIVALLKEQRLPSVSEWILPEYRDDRLLVYAADPLELSRQAARYVDQIFRGARPGELPIMLPSKFELTVNVKMARTIGVAVPPSLLLRADHIIE
jgi:putative ABC transport system substrate-binding protein